MNKQKIVNYSLAIVGFFAACRISQKNMQSTIPQQQVQFDKQGHRGCRGLMPENTWPAMRTALDLGVTTLEMDASITKDEKVILSHEPFFNHEIATKPDGIPVTKEEEKLLNIHQMNYADAARYDVGMRIHPKFPRQQKLAVSKPLLAAVIDSVKQYMITSKRPWPFFNIETKTSTATDNIYHPAPARFVDLLMGVVREKEIEQWTIIQSFDFRTLQYLHIHYPSIQTAMLIEGNDKRSLDEQIKALGFTPTIYSPYYALVTDDLVKACHRKQIRIIPWTVNEKDKIESLKKMGVDGIISDYPDLF